MKASMDDNKSNKKSSRSSFMDRLSQLLLSSSCTATATADATKFIKLSAHVPQPLEPEESPRCQCDAKHWPKFHRSSPLAACGDRRAPALVAPPVIHISIDCGARRSVHSSEPLYEKKKGIKVDDRVSSDAGEGERRKCRPPSSSSKSRKYSAKETKKESSEKACKAKRRETEKLPSKAYSFSSSSSSYSSDDEDEEQGFSGTLFSSKSFSSDSSEFYCSNKKKNNKKKGSKSMKSTRRPPRRSLTPSNCSPVESDKLRPLISISPATEKEEKPEEAAAGGYAVVKRSSDPYMDFRSSMVEMIVERRIKSAKDLELLLESYLSLNSARHHRVILEAFTDIWEAIFCFHD